MQSRNFAALVVIYVSIFWPIRSYAQVQTVSQLSREEASGAPPLLSSAAGRAVASERERVFRLGMISGTVFGAVGGGLLAHHICRDNEPDFGILCPVGVVTVFAGAGALGGILTAAVIAPTVHGPKWKNVLKGAGIGMLMGGITAKAGGAHGRQITWAVLGNAGAGAGTAAFIVARMR
jgi:hypothetical protein